MSVQLEDAVRTVLDHGRKRNSCVEIPAADFYALANGFKASEAHKPKFAPAPRDPAYEREMRQLFANAELDP